MKIGVLGLGYMGATHVSAWKNVPGVTLAAVMSSDEKKLSGDLTAIEGNLGNSGELLDFSAVTKHRTIEAALADRNWMRWTSVSRQICIAPRRWRLCAPANMCWWKSPSR